MATWKQRERQETREGGGRYSRLNPCEMCGKSAGADHYSDERCNRLTKGLVLCAKCIDKAATETTDAGYLALFTGAK